MTPYELGVMLHYYCHPGDSPEVERKPPIWRPTINWLLAEGLLQVNADSSRDATYVLTDRGQFFCEALQQLPLPVHRWEIPHGQASARAPFADYAVDPADGTYVDRSTREDVSS